MVCKTGTCSHLLIRVKKTFSIRWGSVSALALILLLSGCPSPVGGDDDNGEPKTYAVIYDANGATSGSVPVAQIKTHGVALTLATNSGNLADTYFVGWNTSADGTGTDYAEGASYTIDAPLKLFAKWKSFIVGDIGPAGGIVFYVKGNYSDGWRYMEADQRKLSESNLLTWNNDMDGSGGQNTMDGSEDTADYRYTDTPSEAIGSGKANTVKIVEVQGEGVYAASYCANLILGGYDDWFFPSKGELDALILSDAWAKWSIAAGTYGLFWSSTESTKTNDVNGDGTGDGVDYFWAWILGMGDSISSFQFEGNKDAKSYVFAIRSF